MTQIYCDIADIKTIKNYSKKKIVTGFTTNPSLMRKAGAKNYEMYSKEILNSEHFDYFVFGHRHLPLDIKLSEKSRYINLGEWVNYYSYGVLEHGHFELKFFESAFSKAINK